MPVKWMKKISLQTYKTLGKKSNQKSHIKDKQKNESSQHEHWKIKDTGTMPAKF